MHANMYTCTGTAPTAITLRTHADDELQVRFPSHTLDDCKPASGTWAPSPGCSRSFFVVRARILGRKL